MTAGAEAGVAQRLHHGAAIGKTNLQHGTEFLVEQRRDHLVAQAAGDLRKALATVDIVHQWVVAESIEIERNADMRGETHFANGGEQAAVGAVVIGEDLAVATECLYGCKKGLQQRGIDVRHGIAADTVHLGQGRAAETVASLAEINQQQLGFAYLGIRPQLRSQRAANVIDTRKRRDDQGQGGGHLLLHALLRPAAIPLGAHRQGILADRNRHAQRRAEVDADRLHGIEQCRILMTVTGSRHPVRRELDAADIAHIGRCQVGNCLAHRHAARSRCVEQGQRRALAHGEALAAQGVVAHRSNRHIGHRHLPGSDHLVACRETADTAVANGDQEIFGRHGRQPQHAQGGFLQVDAGNVQRRHRDLVPTRIAMKLRRFAEQHFHRHIDRLVAEVIIRHRQMTVTGGNAKHRKRATLALAQTAEFLQAFRSNGQHVTLLCLVAPDFARAHARFFTGQRAQVEGRAATGIVCEFRHGIGNAAGADIVDGEYRIAVTLLPTAVDDFLRATLNLRIAALHRRKIEVGGVRARSHRRRCAAAKADQHTRTTELDQQAARRKPDLEGMFRGNVADAAGNHDRLVIAAHFTAEFLLETAEVTRQIGSAEFVVEGRRADRAFDHDVERRGDALGLAVVRFPGLDVARNAQVGYRKAAQAGLRLGAAPGGALIANLAARSCRCAWKGRDRGRMIVCLDLRQNVGELFAIGVGTITTRIKTSDRRALYHGRIVGVGHHRALRMRLVGFADHAEQGQGLRFPIHRPCGVEDLVPAMLGIGLGEHHEFDVGRIAPELAEVLDQIIDLVIRQRQAQFAVGGDQCLAPARQQIDGGQGLWCDVMEQGPRRIDRRQHRLGHAVVEACRQRQLSAVIGRRPGDMKGGATLDAPDAGKAAIARDVGRLRTPG